MTEIEKKALALLNEVRADMEGSWAPRTKPYGHEAFKALCRAIEQHEAFRQEVSDAVEVANIRAKELKRNTSYIVNHMQYFIIPKPVDPLVEALNDMKDGRAGPTTESYAACLRTALASRGGRIVFDQPEGGAA